MLKGLLKKEEEINLNKMSINTYLSTIESKNKTEAKQTKKPNKQKTNRLIDTENILTVAKWVGG